MSDAGGAPLMLGVSGLRGIVGKSLTPEVAARYAGAFGAWVRERRGGSAGGRARIVIGRDGRAGGDALQRAAIEGLVGAGCDVTDLGVAMTPTVGVVVDELRAEGGVVVTASHNPQEWNGLKCLLRSLGDGAGVDACAPDAGTAGEIIARFRGGQGGAAGEGGEVSGVRGEAFAGHVREVLAGIGGGGEVRARRVRVALDSVNGAGRFAGRALLAGSLGCELIHHGAEDGGVFPHAPEPLRENLHGLAAAVTRFGAEVGFAQDPDADRLAIIDERGEYIGEEYTLALAALALLDGPAGGGERVVCTNLSTSRMIDDVAARHGARVVRTAVGEANVVEAMKRERAAGREVVLGGEGNGGVIWPRVTYVRDSLSAMALVLALMARRGKKVSELVSEIPAYAIEKRKVDLARKEDARPAIEKLAGAFAGERVDRQDGVRIDFDGARSWLHVRASNTEPIMRLIAEAPTEGEARGLLDRAAAMIGV